MSRIDYGSRLSWFGKRLYLSAFGIGYLAFIYSIRALRTVLRKRLREASAARCGEMRDARRETTVVLAAVLLAGVALAGCTRDPVVRRQRYYDSGMQYFEQKKFSEAGIQFRNALRVDPKFAEAATMLARVQLQTREYAEAFRSLQNALQAKPDYLPARLALGALYLAARRTSEARAEAEYVLQQQPENVDALLLAASSLAAEKEFPAAEEILNRIRTSHPSHAGALSALAGIKLAKNESAEAEALLKQVVAHSPSSPEGYLQLAQFYSVTGRPEEAEPLLNQAAGVSNNEPGVLVTQVRFYLERQKWPEAEAVARKIRSLYGDQEAYRGVLADYFIVRNQWVEAKAELERLRQENPEDLENVRKLVEVHLALGDWSSARELNDSILQRNPKDALAHLVQGRLLLLQGDVPNALLELNQTRNFRPDLPALYFWYAEAYVQKGDLEQAKQSLAEALQYDSGFWPARVRLAELQNQTGAPDAALVNAQELLAHNPRDVRAYLLMGQAYMAKKEFRKAEAIFREIVEKVPGNPLGHQQLGILELLEGNPAAARQRLEKAWSLQPDSEGTLRAMVSSYLIQKQAGAAISFLESEITSRPSVGFLYQNLGDVYRLQGKREEAIQSYRQALAHDKNLVGSVIWLTSLLTQTGRVEEARRVISEASEHRPQDASLALTLALTLEAAQRWSEAEKAYERALALDDRNPVALNNLAWLLAERGGNIDVALKLAQRAKAAAANNVQVTNTLGWIYFKKNSHLMALQYLKEAAEREPRNPRYQYQLGVVYSRLGRVAEARRALEAALKLDPALADARRELARFNP